MLASASPTANSPVAPPSRFKGRQRNVWLRAFTFLNALILAFLWWLENSRGENTNLTALLLYMPQHPMAIPTVLLVVASAWRRNFPLFACNFWVLCAWAFSFGGLQVPTPHWPLSRPTVRIVLWNISNWEVGPQTGPQQLRDLKPDIICLAEVAPPPAKLGAHLLDTSPTGLWNASFPGWHVLQVNDVATLSRFPLLDSHTHLVAGSPGRYLIVARWKTPQGPLTTVTTHVSTDLRSGTPIPNHRYNQPRRWLEIAQHARDTARIRAAQWPDIQNSAQGVSDPFIVAGDFNNPPRGQLYRRLTQNWNDAFAQAGWGTGYSFPAHRALMRIDYIWLSPKVQAIRCFSPPTRASDHRPVVADISF